MSTSATRVPRKFAKLEKALLAEREELLSRLASQRADVLIEHEPDDEGAEACGTFSRDLSFSILDQDWRTLEEIEAAHKRLKTGEYGICGVCGIQIPNARLRALPWARLCVRCADPVASASSMPRLRYLRDSS